MGKKPTIRAGEAAGDKPTAVAARGGVKGRKKVAKKEVAKKASKAAGKSTKKKTSKKPAKKPAKKSRARAKADAMPAAPPPPPPPEDPGPDASEAVDRELAVRATRKIRAGDVPTAREQGALGRVEKRREERNRWQYYRTVPKGHYQSMAGTQQKVLNEQAKLYGIPLDGPTVDIVAQVAWLHRFLADNKYVLARAGDGTGQSPKDIREQVEAERARMRLEIEKGELVRRDTVRQGLAKVAKVLREGFATVADTGGEEAGQAYTEVIERAADLFENGEAGV